MVSAEIKMGVRYILEVELEAFTVRLSLEDKKEE